MKVRESVRAFVTKNRLWVEWPWLRSAVIVWMDPTKRSLSSTALGPSGRAPPPRTTPSSTPEVRFTRVVCAAASKQQPRDAQPRGNALESHPFFWAVACVLHRAVSPLLSPQKRISPQSPPGTPGVRCNQPSRGFAFVCSFFFFFVRSSPRARVRRPIRHRVRRKCHLGRRWCRPRC